MKSVYKHHTKKILKNGPYTIWKNTDAWGNFDYVLTYNNNFQERSWDFNALKAVAFDEDRDSN